MVIKSWREVTLSRTKGFEIGNHLPAFGNTNRCRQSRLSTIGGAVADVIKQEPVFLELDLCAFKISRQRVEALSHRTLAVVISSVALGAVGEVNIFAAFNMLRILHI